MADPPAAQDLAPPPRASALRQLSGGALIAALAQATLLVANAGISVAVARLLGSSGTGVYGVAATVFAILAPTSTLGLRAGTMFLVSRDEWTVRRAFWQSQASAAALIAVTGAIAFGLWLLWRDGPLEGLTAVMLALVVAAAGLWVSWTFSTAILLARERYEAFGLTQIIQAAASLLVSIALMVPFDVEGALAGLALSQLAAALFAGWRVLALAAEGRGAGRTGRFGELRAATRYGVKTWLGELFWGVNVRIDVVVLNAYVASAVVGPYFVATSLAAIAWILPGALQTVLIPRAAALEASVERGERSTEESDATVARSMRHGVLTSLPIALALVAVVAVGVPLLYGSEFTDAIGYFLILLPGVLAAGVSKVAVGALAGRGRPGLTVLPLAVVTPFTVIAYLIVIPGAGATGAAIVSTLAYASISAFMVVLLVRTTGISLRSMLVPRRDDLAAYRPMVASLVAYVRDRRRPASG